MKQGIILFGHGARNPDWAAPFHRVRAAILARQPAAAVALGFLEYLSPNFDECVAALLTQEVQQIAVVPLFISSGMHVREGLPELANAAMARHPGLIIRLAEPLGEAQAMIDAMAGYALDAVPPD